MSKKGKDAEDDETAWKKEIESKPLDDERWSVKVYIMEVAGTDNDRIYLSKFEEYATLEKRFVIKNISRQETHFMINQLGGEKKVKDPKLRVFEEAQAYLKEKKEVPSDIMALVIKYLVLKIKEDYLYIMRQKEIVKEGMKRESVTMIGKAEVKGSSVVKPPTPVVETPITPEVKSPKGKEAKSAKVEEIPIDEDKKYNTMLRVRGEDWRDRVYVDDYPEDGPNIYVSLTNFQDPYLACCLLRIGVPMVSVIQVRIDPIQKTVPSSLTRQTRRGQSKTEVLTEIAMKFWEDLIELRLNKETRSEFKNTAFIVFTPPYWEDQNLSGDPENIYDDLSYLMYDVQDLSRQHKHYLYNMEVLSVPTDTEYNTLMKYYSNGIDDLPLESFNMYSLLDSMIHAIKIGRAPPESSESSENVVVAPQKSNIIDQKIDVAQSLINKVFETFSKDEDEAKKYRITYGEEAEKYKDPVIINHGDIAKYSTFHLGNINLHNIVFKSLLYMPINKLWNTKPRLPTRTAAKVNLHLNILHSCFEREDIEPEEMDRLIHILACRKIFNNRSALHKRKATKAENLNQFKNIYLKRSVLATPLMKCPSVSLESLSPTRTSSFHSIQESDYDESDHLKQEPSDECESINYLFNLPDLTELVSAAEIACGEPIKHMIDDFVYFEDYEGHCAFQILLNAFNSYNCVDYKYCEVTDCIILMFYNSHDEHGIFREEWRSHIPTPVCLQDFFDFVLEEVFEWLQNEERFYDKNRMELLKSEKNVINPDESKMCIYQTDVARELLIEGSLKHAQHVAEELAAEEEAASVKLSSKKQKSNPISIKSAKQLHSVSSTMHFIKKPFCGYDLGDRRLEVFGKDASFFSKDGTKLRSIYYLIIPESSEYSCLNIIPGNGKSDFYIHRAFGEAMAPDQADVGESFRILMGDRMMINIKKRTYKVSIMDSSAVDTAAKSNLENIEKDLGAEAVLFDPHVFYSFYITWPTGLVVESVHDPNSSKITHIKQTYLTSALDLKEDNRCVTANGEVIIFNTDESIDVYKHDGTHFRITDYGQVPVYPEEPPTSEPPPDPKGKVKSPVSSRKKGSSPKVPDEPVVLQPLYYDMRFNEYDVIQSNGKKLRCIKDFCYPLGRLLIRTATDYNLGEIFSKRMDGTTILLNKEGILLVTYPNGLRIVTRYIVEDNEVYPEWTPEELEFFSNFETPENVDDEGSMDTGGSRRRVSLNKSTVSSPNGTDMVGEEQTPEPPARTDGFIVISIVYSVEHKNFATVTVNKSDDTITIASPNGSSLIIDSNIHYTMKLDEVTTATFDDHVLHIDYEACVKCNSFTRCNVQVRPDEAASSSMASEEVERIWADLRDSFGQGIIVDEEGGMHKYEVSDDTEELQCPLHTVRRHSSPVEQHEEAVPSDDGKSETSASAIGRCRELYDAKKMKFFVMRRNLTCSELIHRALIEEYQQACRWQPWCSINTMDTFGDHRRTVCILSPIYVTETELWLMESHLADKPKLLTYKDLKKETKGWYHWMRPYERFQARPTKPGNVLPLRTPKAFVLRGLELQWTDEAAQQLRGGRELLAAILKYRQVLESDSQTILNVPIVDTRLQREQNAHNLVQTLCRKLFDEWAAAIQNDVMSRACADITTEAPPVPLESEEIEAEGIYAETEELEEGSGSLEEQIQSVEMTPQQLNYWKHRELDYELELFYKQLLREVTYPPYFKNILGGAIWWEVNNAATEATRRSERRKMRCQCHEDYYPHQFDEEKPLHM